MKIGSIQFKQLSSLTKISPGYHHAHDVLSNLTLWTTNQKLTVKVYTL